MTSVHGPRAWATGGIPTTANFDVALRTHTVTFGLSYKFSGMAAPLVAN